MKVLEKNFDELKNQRFDDITKTFGCSDVYIFEKTNSLSIKLFELSFYQVENE